MKKMLKKHEEDSSPHQHRQKKKKKPKLKLQHREEEEEEEEEKEEKKKKKKKKLRRHRDDKEEKEEKKKKKPKLQHREDEEEKNREQDANPSSNQNTKYAIVTDPRFAAIHYDPRFQRIPRKESKVPIDNRFARMLSDERFADSSAPVDKRGKPSKKETNPLLHYYLHQDKEKAKMNKGEEEEEDSDGLEMGVSLEEEEEEAMYEISSTDDDDEDDEEDDQNSVNSDICHYLMARHEDTPIAEQETHRLAVVNLDWDHIKAVDIYVVMSSCLPKGGQILSVAIYPTEFGVNCMKVEAERGPSDLIGKNEDDNEDEEVIDDEKLRTYELNKLRYYYAVVVFDSIATANHIYGNLDGIEFLRTSNVLDLRFIPDSMEFSQPPRDITTEAPTNYKQPDFETRALQHSKVNLTWEEDEPHRTKVLRQKFNSDQLDELNEYLATSESDDGDEEGHDSENEVVAALSNGEGKKNMDREKLRALLLSENASGSDEDEDKDMEITFNTGLEDLSKRILEKKEKKSETVWEQVLRKRSEKKKERRNHSKNSSEDDSSDYDDQEAPDQPDDYFMEEEPSDSDLEVSHYNDKDLESTRAKKNRKGTKKSPDTGKEQEASRAELELLFAEDQEGKDHGQKGYNMKLKKVKGKKGKEAAAEMKLPDVDPSADPRFSARLSSHDFALDPTDPQYKRSIAYAKQRVGKRRTSRETEDEEETGKPPEHNQMLSDDLVPLEKEKYELSSTVRSLKRNLQSLKKCRKALKVS